MDKCPKCEQGRMDGPHYNFKHLSGLPGTTKESLSYQCTKCGYVQHRPTADSKLGGLGRLTAQ